MGFHPVVADALGHTARSPARHHRDISLSHGFIVLADSANSFRKCVEAKAIDRLAAFGGGDLRMRMARVGLYAGGDLELGAAWAVGVGVRKHRAPNAEREFVAMA